MFYAPNGLAELVRRPGGKPRDTAIADAARNVEAKKDFLLEGIRDGVLSIEAVMLAVDAPAIPAIHSDMIIANCDRIIGLAGVLGFAALEAAAKSLCDLMASLDRLGETEKAPVLVHVQAIHRLTENLSEIRPEDDAVLLAQLARLVKHYEMRSRSVAR